MGNFSHVPVSDQAKAILFLLFLFGIGCSVGPSFFQAFKGDGWRWMWLGMFVPVIGLLAAYSVAHFLKLDVGYSADLLSGSLTKSPLSVLISDYDQFRSARFAHSGNRCLPTCAYREFEASRFLCHNGSRPLGATRDRCLGFKRTTVTKI
jgi:Predicted Permease Membrane Region